MRNRLGALVLSSFLVAVPFASASPGWTAGGSLVAARASQTATLLPTGKVLVVGGRDASGPLATAELYDPATGTSKATGSLAAPRFAHTATMLRNGKVLIVGGSNGAGYLASAELYDPASGTFSPAGALAAPRAAHTATLLPDGRVLVAGGAAGGPALKDAELYDPAANQWSSVPQLLAGRAYHTATLLASGDVLIAGGVDGAACVAPAELFRTSLGAFVPTGPLVAARQWHAAVLLPSGKVLVAGGAAAGGAPLASAELYDPATGLFAPTGALAAARFDFAASLLPNGTALAAGGNGAAGVAASAEIFDPATEQWTTVAAPPAAAADQTATLLPSGRALLLGGWNAAPLAVAQQYDASSAAFAPTASMAEARRNHRSVLLPNGKVLVAGGATAEVYDPATGRFGAPIPLVEGRVGHTATLLRNGKVLIAGGVGDTGAELFDPAANGGLGGVSATGATTTARRNHTATLLPDGRVLLAGGRDASNQRLASAELYDPATGFFTAAGSLVKGREFHTATLLPNGKVLIAGGMSISNGPWVPAELYDPITGAFVAGANLVAARYYHTATLLPSGKVLLAGGLVSSGPAGGAELYDPAAGTFAATGSMAGTRYYNTATLLPSGRVLMAGGVDGYASLGTTELYDPANGTFVVGPSLAAVRTLASATLLPNGRTLIAGGFELATQATLASAELYDTGSGAAEAWRPAASALTDPIVAGEKVEADGTLFAGLNGLGPEGSGGGYQSSATNYPLLQLRRLDSEQTVFLPLDPQAGASGTSFTSSTGWCLPPGPATATVFVDGIAGAARFATVVVPAPTIAGPAINPCGSNAATLTTETGMTNYQWLRDGKAIAGATGATYAATAAGSYAVRYTRACTIVTSAAHAVTIDPDPSPSVSGPAEACESATVSTGAFASYQWNRDGAPIDGATGQSYVATAGGVYGVTVTNARGCPATSAGKSVVVDTHPAIFADPVAAAVCAGADASFNVQATGSGLSYRWQVSADGGTSFADLADGAPYSGTGAATLAVAKAGQDLDGKRYRAVVSGICPSPATSAAAALAVGGPYSAPLLGSVAVVALCERDGVRATFAAASGAARHDLYKDGAPVVSGYASGDVYKPGDAAPHTYFVRAVNGACSADSASSALADDGVTPPAVAGLALSKDAANLKFAWTPIADPTFVDFYELLRAASPDGTFDVLVGDATGAAASVALAAEPPTAYYKIRAVKRTCRGPAD